MTTIIIDINEDGSQAKVSVKGATGSSCEALTKDIEAALGKTTKNERTPEFHNATQTRNLSR